MKARDVLGGRIVKVNQHQENLRDPIHPPEVVWVTDSIVVEMPGGEMRTIWMHVLEGDYEHAVKTGVRKAREDDLRQR